jgi:mitochondrial chaperone BCS1
LGSLLILLDGILELYGSFIIMTTNHLEKLDPALVRPGRINYKLFLDRMKRPAMCEMIELYLNHKYTVEDLQKLGIDEDTHSAAEIESLLLTSSTRDEFEMALRDHLHHKLKLGTTQEK